MSKLVRFDATIAARTRAAVQILATPDLLAAYEARGGLEDDLKSIRDQGRKAEALGQAENADQAGGGAGALYVLGNFVALQREYAAIMAVVQAARLDLSRAGAPVEVLTAVDEILANEAEVLIAKKKAGKSVSQEALRAEIASHARALQNLASIHNALEKRRVDGRRLAQLITVAKSLSGKLSKRAAARSTTMATSALRDAVGAQEQVWSACYRLLAAVGNEDARVAQLLSEAAYKRSSKKAKAKKG